MVPSEPERGPAGSSSGQLQHVQTIYEVALSDEFSGRYELLELLGEGGMGVVHRATQKAFSREVAIKFLVSDSGWLRERFLREGTLMARLSHPNIVQVYDRGEERGHLFLVQGVRGETLASYIHRQRSLPPAEALRLGRELAAGLAEAHAAGILHRDVKPANVLLTAARVAKLADFGLCRDLGDRQTTAAGTVLGTVGYMAPEVALGRGAQATADVYSLGVTVFYEMLSGKLPYPADTILGYVRQQMDDPPPLEELVPGLAPQLSAFVRRCMDRQPELRYRDSAAVLVALDQLGAAAGQLAVPTTSQVQESKERPASAARLKSAAQRPAAQARPLPAPSPRASAPGGKAPLWIGAAAGLSLLVAAIALGRGERAAHVVAPAAAVSPAAARPEPASDPMGPPPAMPAGMKLRRVNSAGYHTCENEKDGTILIAIPGGTFEMGTAAIPECSPVHRVTVSPYFLAVNDVTWKQYAKFCEATHRAPQTRPPWAKDNHPVVNVNWQDAADYCRWAGGRLPTEAEWELAARGEAGRSYPWGDDPPGEGAAKRGNFADDSLGRERPEWVSVRGYDDGYPHTSPVGSFPDGASPYGALDLAGNVAQWCSDFYRNNYYTISPDHDPPGPPEGLSHTFRGGSWDSPAVDLGSASRRRHESGIFNTDIGFRLAR